MSTRRVWGVLFTDAEQQAIRQICESYNSSNEIEVPRNTPIHIDRVLVNKLSKLKCVWSEHSHGISFNAKIMELKEELNEPIDQWERLTTWFRSRKWAIPVGLVVIGLPLAKGYIEMFQWVINAILGTPAK